jgi:uncharacterized cupredoxin-like copper-binding protein
VKPVSWLDRGWQRARLLVAIGLTSSAVVIAGCGPAQTGEAIASGGPVLEVIGLDTMRFDPETIRVTAGETVTIHFRNKGVIPHDLITQGGEKNARLANLAGGREAKGVFQASKPGTYPMLCVQPGHREAGMVGRIVVE